MPPNEKIDLKAAPEVTPSEAPASEIPPLARAGVDLAKWVFVIVSVFIVVALALLAWNEVGLFQMETSYTQQLKPDMSTAEMNMVKEFIAQLEVQRKAFREFWLQFLQMILLNLLLPVLTAILGYIFGSKVSDQ
ncbi:MAG: hypothetical protein ACOYYU_11885 [Chloroflexota bacterium]